MQCDLIISLTDILWIYFIYEMIPLTHTPGLYNFENMVDMEYELKIWMIDILILNFFVNSIFTLC